MSAHWLDLPRSGRLSAMSQADCLRSLFGSGNPRHLYVGLSVLRTGPMERAYPLEPHDLAYHRIQVANTPENWPVRSDWLSDVMLNFRLAWPVPTQDWGRVTELVIFDAEHGGQLVGYCPINRARGLEVLEGVALPVTPPGYYRLGVDGL